MRIVPVQRLAVCARTACLPSRLGHCTNSDLTAATPGVVTTFDDDSNIATSVVSQVTINHCPSYQGSPDDLGNTSLSQSSVPSSVDHVATPTTDYQLPAPTPMAAPTFVWGNCDSDTFMHSVSAAYVHWRRNTVYTKTHIYLDKILYGFISCHVAI